MKRNVPLLALGLVGVGFVAGIIYLFLLRFEAGDVYPPYSSLRADPLGTMALCESLARLPGREVRRDTTDANKLPEERNITYLHLAAEVGDWRWLPDELFDEIERFLGRGGRLVVTFRPLLGWEFRPGPGPAPLPPPVPITNTNAAGTNAPTKAPARKATGKRSPAQPLSMAPADESLAKRWGVNFSRQEMVKGDNDVYQAAPVSKQADLPLPDSLRWHSELVLTNLAPAWRVIYARGTNAVLVERQFGRGSVVLATDSYFLSNQALWQERHPDLLAWLIGPAEQVVFDEGHLGVVETSGVAKLMRQYRLTGVIGAVVVLAVLFIWKNAFSLVPPYAGEVRSPYVPGKDATAGFVNLLRRNISPGQLLEICFEQWTRSLLHRANYRIAAIDQAQTIMERERARATPTRNPVQAYREIAQALQSPVTHHASRITPSATPVAADSSPKPYDPK